MKVAVSWSGGKDSCFACYKAIEEGYEVSQLFTMMSESGKSNFHLISSELLDAQSSALQIPIAKRVAARDAYEEEFKRALREMKARGIEGLVTGDIYEVALHEAGWLDRICSEVGLKPVKPLWHRDTGRIMNEFVNAGFKAVVVRVKNVFLGLEWLGRQIDEKFADDLARLGGVDPCGERGEFHTLVTDGPLFRSSIEILETEKTTSNGYGRLEIKSFKVKSKEQ